MHDAQVDLIALLVLLAGSFLMPVLSGRIHIPAAVLLIGFGILVGPQILDLVPGGEVALFLYEVGFIILMFLAGLEIDFNQIRSRGRLALLVVAGVCLTISGLAFGIALAFGLPAIFGLALGATSVGLPLAVLKETGRLRSAVGQLVILAGSVGEFLTLVAMTLFYFTTRYGPSFELLFGLGKLLAVLAGAGLLLRVFTALAWWQPQRFSRFVEADDGSEIGVRASLLLMMTFSIAAILAGVESIVGSFLAGALIAFVLRGKAILEDKLAVVGHGFFVPIFFVIVGIRFDLRAVDLDSLLVAGGLLVAFFLIRLLPSLAFLRQGLTLRDTLGIASLLATPLTLVVAIAALGRDLGVLETGDSSTLIVLAVASGVLFPVVFRWAEGRGPAEQGEAG